MKIRVVVNNDRRMKKASKTHQAYNEQKSENNINSSEKKIVPPNKLGIIIVSFIHMDGWVM